ncbi:hypothetical protein NKDENANG_01550 [Candidatus Entotheonellaceae bacterium PAL068K]
MACFDHAAVIVGGHGRHVKGAEAIRNYYASNFTTFQDAKCTIHTLVGADGVGTVESFFTGTRASADYPMRLMGAEVLGCRGDKIAALRDYHTVG